ncbi:SpoIIE family protein phosphatase [Actinacidiphila glaucinigra]|uniref:SpoIIE family protein phosphatase n=1 Tax=Actinacidiphila glaucinigra TaxID=235986 RepID=UPI002DD8AF59|nr:SpoIIE family protein phosphatase [Actinacidiphila glaucinigra]WSD61939.1 SpoIIE family protein phosphatase [Actinacidiphila glaucinigra]
MHAHDPPPPGTGREARPSPGAASPGGLLDLLQVAAMVLDRTGHIVLWSPEAERLFGYSAAEALGQNAGLLLVAPDKLELVTELFKQVRAGAIWQGVFPIVHADGTTRDVEFRNMRMHDVDGGVYALGLGADLSTVRRVETDMALSSSLVDQSPIGLAVFDTDLRIVRVNRAMEELHGLPAAAMLGRRVREISRGSEFRVIEARMREVLETGEPLLDQDTVVRTYADQEHDHAWSISYYRIQDATGRVLGLAASIADFTERHQAAEEIAEARGRLAVIAEAGTRIGTTLDLQQTAQELASVVVPTLADIATVDVLDEVLRGGPVPKVRAQQSAEFRALAVAAADSGEAIGAVDPVGELARYTDDRLITKTVREGLPVVVHRVSSRMLRRIARDDRAAAQLKRAGAHSYLAAPLIARGEVLGVVGMFRTRNQKPFDDEDRTLALELAARAAISIDNARLYAGERNAALTLQRSLLPHEPPRVDGMEISARYIPAVREVGGDWYDVLQLRDGKVGLIVGDVMGKGLHAAAIMGQLRTATRAFSRLDLPPHEVLAHLDNITGSAEGDFIATCVYAVCDPATGRCQFSTAGHLPPVLVPPGGRAELIDLPSAVPLGVGGIRFRTVERKLSEGTLLALFTDGLVEDRRQSIDVGLRTLMRVLKLKSRHRTLEDTCDVVLGAGLQSPDDDVALLLARMGAPAAGDEAADES